MNRLKIIIKINTLPNFSYLKDLESSIQLQINLKQNYLLFSITKIKISFRKWQ